MFREIDWKKEDLIYYAKVGAKGWYVGNSGHFLGYSVKDHFINLNFDDISQRKQTLAVDNLGEDSNIIINYHLWSIVKKKDMPKGIKWVEKF